MILHTWLTLTLLNQRIRCGVNGWTSQFMVARREMSFIKELSLTKPQKMGFEKQTAVYEKNGHQLGSEKRKKNGAKSKKLVTWAIREIIVV